MDNYHFLMILFGWFITGASPGPATLAISSTAMEHGRRAGVTIACGILLGSSIWGLASAAGMSAIMVANAWLFDVIRYAGALYLLYLALKSLKNAIRPKPIQTTKLSVQNLFLKGFLIHLTNPKAIFAWGSIYALIFPSDAGLVAIFETFLLLMSIGASIFIGYGLLFSTPAIARGYASLKRWFDAAFAILFGGASLKLLTSRIEV